MVQITGSDSLVHSARLMNADGIHPFTMLCVGSSPTLLGRRLRNLVFGGSNPPPVILFYGSVAHWISAMGFELGGWFFPPLKEIPRTLQTPRKTPIESGSIPDRAFGGSAMKKEKIPEMYGCRISLSAVFVWQDKVNVQSERVMISPGFPQLPKGVCSRILHHLLPQASGTTIVDEDEVNPKAEPPLLFRGWAG